LRKSSEQFSRIFLAKNVRVLSLRPKGSAPIYPENHRGIWTNTRLPVIILVLYRNFVGSYVMATYACNKCEMAVNTSCAKCDVTLINDSLEPDNETKGQIAKLLW
jgi:hypothetical protein